MLRKIKKIYENPTKTLSEAVREDKPFNTIKKLVEAKADVNFPLEKPPLYEIIEHSRDIPSIKYLLEKKANVHWTNEGGKNKLLRAAVDQHSIEVTKILLENKADINGVDFQYGYTPLHLAARGLHENAEEIVKILLEYKASPHIENKIGYTPYYLATMKYFYLQKTRILKVIMFLLSIEGDKYKDAMEKYTEEVRLFKSTILTHEFITGMLEFFSSDIIVNIIIPYLLPDKPKHPMPDILKPAENTLEKDHSPLQYFFKLATKINVHEKQITGVKYQRHGL